MRGSEHDIGIMVLKRKPREVWNWDFAKFSCIGKLLQSQRMSCRGALSNLAAAGPCGMHTNRETEVLVGS